jgi:hypothetical protein
MLYNSRKWEKNIKVIINYNTFQNFFRHFMYLLTCLEYCITALHEKRFRRKRICITWISVALVLALT